MSGDFKMDDYNDVPSRIRQFRDKHPDGSLQAADLSQPYRIETIGNDTFIIYTAAAFRSPDDPRPGIGIAWEQVPGKTSFTRGSEIQNAETSAWGRAIVAALAADTKRIASDEEIRGAQGRQNAAPQRIVDLATDIATFANDDFRTWVAEEFKTPWSESDCDEIETALKPYRDVS